MALVDEEQNTVKQVQISILQGGSCGSVDLHCNSLRGSPAVYPVPGNDRSEVACLATNNANTQQSPYLAITVVP